MTFNDCFGNTIIVTDLSGAIEQAKMFVGWGEQSLDGGYKFDEFKLIKSTDTFGKQITLSKNTNSGKYVRQRLYWKHTLCQLLKIKAT